ncbi:MAG: tRNA 2-thiouridine(34) synthase MnmA [Salinivirgaceae bacterium]|jgi:tRNA-specific 2-thiouridylase|nr:tRNA 2-thiouridine(34) synthase MnmA [Salinivirgaceae bacterium]
MKVLLGMSGGVDSSVAAMLLKEQGYEVVGVTLRLWSETDGFTNTELPTYINEAKNLANALKIEHHVVDVRREFYDLVIDYFKTEYLAGKTPNPCAKCNVVLKWKELDDFAQKTECDFIATGHYVNKIEENDRFYISKGIDPDKEQSFFLWGLSQDIFKKAVFPLGNLTKQQVKEKAVSMGFLKLNNKKESTGVCFLKDKNYQAFLKREFVQTDVLPGKGYFIDQNGVSIGEHSGHPFYTVGQRRGLGLVPREPLYVTQILPESNKVVLGHRNDLYKESMLVKNYNIISKNDFNTEVITRVRYRKQSAVSKVEFIDNNILKVLFSEPEWSIAPGQTAAFYSGDKLLGGGFIIG